MRLLSRVGGKLHVTSDLEPPAKYAILSHRWLSEDDEVSYRDVKSGGVDKATFRKLGQVKLDFCLDRAAEDGIESVWIDSCCIDRTDKLEVGKSINQMYEYYSQAAICYVYLSDVKSGDWQRTLATSQWFTRGWTLQELVAPTDIRFYSCDRVYIGNGDSLSRELLAITGVSLRSPVQDVPFHMRFGWSLTRTTKEPEDASYCLLGILEVSLVVNYGEGATQARERLFDAVEREHGRKAVRAMQATATPNRLEGSLTLAQISQLLRYRDMNTRRLTIAHPFRDTWQWLLKHPDYRSWNDMESQFIWVKGKPGAGKSTLMKFAYESGRKNCAQVSFFFNARGDILEKHVEGMFRSLLYQLLEQVPSTREPVRQHLEREQKCTGSIAFPFPYSLPTLQAAFREAVRNMTERTQCFIDALDECKYSEVQEMVHFLEDVSFRTHLYICFASRYYPSVTIKSKELPLEAQNDQSRDLMDYVRGRLNAGDDLKQQVIDKANGIFFWAVLVVRLLNAEISDGRSYNIRKRLDELPSELSDLLEAILAPKGHAQELQLACQWILFAKRPLSPVEYYFAVLIGMHQLDLTSEDLLEPWPKINPGFEMIEKFVASSSRGLAELTRSDHPKVQFIHESVRDFLLDHGGLLGILQGAAPPDPIAWSHGRLSDVCFQYAASMKALDLLTHECYAKYRFPFLGYAVTALFHHAELAEDGKSKDEFLQEFIGQTQDWKSVFNLSFCTVRDLGHVEREHREFHSSRRRKGIFNLIDIFAYKGYVKLIFAASRIGLRLRTTLAKPPFESGLDSEQEVLRALRDCQYLRENNNLPKATST